VAGSLADRIGRKRTGVAQGMGGATGALIAHAASSGFMSGAHLGLLTAAVVALAGSVIALATIPGKAPAKWPAATRPRTPGAHLPTH